MYDYHKFTEVFRNLWSVHHSDKINYPLKLQLFI